MDTSILDEIFMSELLYKQELYKFKRYCKVFKIRAAIRAKKRARMFLKDLHQLRCEFQKIQSMLAELNKSNAKPTIKLNGAARMKNFLTVLLFITLSTR